MPLLIGRAERLAIIKLSSFPNVKLNGMGFGYRVISGSEYVGHSVLNKLDSNGNTTKTDRAIICAWYRRFINHSIDKTAHT